MHSLGDKYSGENNINFVTNYLLMCIVASCKLLYSYMHFSSGLKMPVTKDYCIKHLINEFIINYNDAAIA